ncbi:RNA polymerase sigma factor [Nocardia sp. NPDC003482]
MDTQPGDQGGQARWILLAAHRGRLVEIARVRLPSLADAEDCVSEAMIKAFAYEALDLDRVGGFLTTVVIRLCVDYHRRAERTERLLTRLRESEAIAGPEQSVCADSAVQDMLRAVARLPVRQRQIVIARIAGSSTAEAAGQLGISIKAAESALTRARARLAAEPGVA